MKAVNEQETLSLTVQDVIDYMVCGLYYDCKVNRKEPMTFDFSVIRNEKFENTMKQVMFHFLFKKQAGIQVEFKTLLKKWEKLWFPKDLTVYDIAVERHAINYDNIHVYSSLAVGALHAFIEHFSDPRLEVMILDEDFIVPLPNHIRLQGKFDIVLRTGGAYRIIKLISKRNRPKPHQFEFAALRSAFEHRNDRYLKATYHLYDLAANGNPFVPVLQPTTNDVDALVYWASEIRENPSYVPRRGFTSYCKGCSFDDICRRFTFPTESDRISSR